MIAFTSLKGEEWRSVVGYEGYYAVSNRGRVKSSPRVIVDKNGLKKSLRGGILPGWIGNHGYWVVCLARKSQNRFRLVHVLIAEAFIPNSNPGVLKTVDHKNRVRADNRISNLRWTTQKLNVLNSDQSPRGDNRRIGVYEHADGRSKRFGVRFENRHRGSFSTLKAASEFRNAIYQAALSLAI